MNLDYTSLNTLYKSYRDAFTPYIGDTKESYLEWRKNWRSLYKQLSADIRELKRCRKRINCASDIEQENAINFAEYFSSTATYAMEYRTESKIAASENYLKSKEAQAA